MITRGVLQDQCNRKALWLYSGPKHLASRYAPTAPEPRGHVLLPAAEFTFTDRVAGGVAKFTVTVVAEVKEDD